MNVSSGFRAWMVGLAALGVAACGNSSSEGGGAAGTEATGGTTGDGGVTFVDGANPPDVCDGTEGGVCVLPDEGIPIPDGDGGTVQCFLVQCENRITACGDCTDNDGDGLIDFLDPECLGPCDNYEGPELFAGVGGERAEQCKADCYFDFGNGAGNDDCHWSRSCDPLEPKAQCTYDERDLGSRDCPDEQSDLCYDFCTPLTPNGCDCFGCCTFPELEGAGPEGGPGYVYIGSEEGCTFDTVTDPNRCKPCTPTGNCLNTCERCEICLGKPTVPPDCIPDDPNDPPPDGPRCHNGRQECGLPGEDPCEPGYFCVTGCCTLVVQ